MTTLALWTSGQLLIEQANALLVFAGIRVLLQQIAGLIRAFHVRQIELEG